jgi:hypothetical protein
VDHDADGEAGSDRQRERDRNIRERADDRRVDLARPQECEQMRRHLRGWQQSQAVDRTEAAERLDEKNKAGDDGDTDQRDLAHGLCRSRGQFGRDANATGAAA